MPRYTHEIQSIGFVHIGERWSCFVVDQRLETVPRTEDGNLQNRCTEYALLWRFNSRCI